MFKFSLSISISTVWIISSEYFRNEILLKSYWLDHYKSIGVAYPSSPVNGAMWGVWSLMLSVSLSMLIDRFSLIKSILIAWLMAFGMMWVVIGNLGFLPHGLLQFAIPLSGLEVFVAAIVIKKLKKA